MEDEHPKTAARKTLIGIFIIIVLCSIFYLTLLTSSTMQNVMLSFLPALLYLIIIIYVVETHLGHLHWVFYGIPFLLTTIIFSIYKALGLLPSADILQLGAMNILASLAFGFVVNFVGMTRPPISETESEPEDITADNLVRYLSVLEDKCKALNSVYGRVYKARSGGSPQMREPVRFTPELYNRISFLVQNFTDENKNELLSLVDEILKKLYLLYNTEKSVFGDLQLKYLMRNEDGTSRVVDVLIMNDLDPVQQYVENAVDIASRAKVFLERDLKAKGSKKFVKNLEK
ncbi:MAG: hypothetical protein ABIH41_03105 [Nanoarchaeota archaeon]